MRKMLFFVLLTVCSLASAQKNNDAIQTLFSNYEQKEGFTSVLITPKAFALAAKLTANNADAAEATKLLSKLKYLNILTKEGDGRGLYKEAISRIQTSDYEPLMVVKGEDNVQFLTKSTGDVINELFMVVGSDTDFALISFVGDIDINDLSKLGEKVGNNGDMKALKSLEKLKKD
jgi:Domain of unknown function (DUF4252)